jgi:hypothetical protein
MEVEFARRRDVGWRPLAVGLPFVAAGLEGHGFRLLERPFAFQVIGEERGFNLLAEVFAGSVFELDVAEFIALAAAPAAVIQGPTTM